MADPVIGNAPYTPPSVNAEEVQKQAQAQKGPSVFGNILKTVAGVAANIFVPGLGGVLGGGMLSRGMSSLPGITNSADPMQFLMAQQQMNAESRAFEMASTALKAKHDAAMSAIRNMR
jgi:hypothetical protein